MHFQQFYLGCLSHASYLIGSGGEAAVVDPQRDVDIYMETAHELGLEIRAVIETHLHADFVSGHRELAERTGATVYVGSRSGATFPHVPVKDGMEIRLGDVALRFLETPGHTMEGICVVVTDLANSADPVAVLTGDTLFVGDVGRPDLDPNHTPQELAGFLYDSLQTKVLTLPDGVQVWPAHGAGSMCGRQLGTERSSTIGDQKRLNYALQARSREEFISLLTGNLPERPGYFARDAEINRHGAPAIQPAGMMAALSPAEVADAQKKGAVVLDTRGGADFCAGHVPGALQIGLGGQFATWAGIVLGLDQEIVVVADHTEKAEEARMRLARVGIEGVIGYLDGGMRAWADGGRAVAKLAEVSPQELHARDGVRIVDVRKQAEWDDGHIASAELRPLTNLASRLEGLDKSQPIAVHCKGGYRSLIAASILQRAGFAEVWNVSGGFDSWTAAGLPVTR